MALKREPIVQTVQEESVLIDKAGVVALYDAVRKMMGFGLGGLLYRAGKAAGKQSARLLAQRLNLEGEDLLQALLIAFETSHWGTADLNRTSRPWRLQVYDSVLATNIHSKKPVCHPIAGYWAGFLETALGRTAEVREVQCAATGASHCEFEVILK